MRGWGYTGISVYGPLALYDPNSWLVLHVCLHVNACMSVVTIMTVSSRVSRIPRVFSGPGSSYDPVTCTGLVGEDGAWRAGVRHCAVPGNLTPRPRGQPFISPGVTARRVRTHPLSRDPRPPARRGVNTGRRLVLREILQIKFAMS